MRGTLWSLAGTALPSVVGVVVVPRLVRGFGAERFGILSLAFAVIGYFSLFDFGIGRAVTHEVSDRVARGEREVLAPTIWTAWYFMLGVGIVGAIVAALAAPFAVARFVHPPEHLYSETSATFTLLALSIPVVVVTAGVRGVLEAFQRFDLINAVRVPSGIITFVGPLLTLAFTPSVFAAVWVLLLARLVMLAAYAAMCLRLVPGLRALVRPSRDVLARLARFGAWMTVSNTLSPLMMIADRFVVSAVISVAAVTFYATPYDAVTRLLIIPSALAGVLFPTFAAQGASGSDGGIRMLATSYRVIFLAMAPLMGGLILFAPELLRLWLGSDFERASSNVLRWIAVGVLANGLAQIAFSYVQGRGRADLTAKAHLIETPLYLAGLYSGVKYWGIDGAAAVWCLRAILDLALLTYFARRLANPGATTAATPSHRIPLIAFGIALVGGTIGSLGLRLFCLVASMSMFVVAAYREPGAIALLDRVRSLGWMRARAAS